jgi:hypothetical protein
MVHEAITQYKEVANARVRAAHAAQTPSKQSSRLSIMPAAPRGSIQHTHRTEAI